MTSHPSEPGNGRCRLCLRDLFRHGHGDVPYCDACLLLLRRHPGVDPASLRNGRTERLPQERPSSDPRWSDTAACAGAPVELFEHRKLDTDAIPVEIRQAAAVLCARCPILERCRAEADEHEFVGLWAGQWRRYDAHAHYRYTARDLIHERETAA